MSNSKALLLEVLSYGVAKLVPAAVNLSVIFLLANFYDHTQYGVYILLFSTVSSLNALLFHWIRIRAVNVSAVAGFESMQRAAVTSFYFVILCCILVSVILPAFVPVEMILIVLLCVISQSYFELSLEFSRLRFSVNQFLKMSMARAFLTVSIVALALYFHSNIEASTLLLFISSGFVISASLFGSRFVGTTRLSFREAKDFASVGLFFCFITAGEAIVSVIDKFYVKSTLSNDLLVSYGLLFLIVKQGFGIFGLILYTSLYPRALGSGHKRNGLLVYALVLFLVGGLLSVLLTYVSPSLLYISLPLEIAEISAVSVNWAIAFGFIYMMKVYVFDMVGASYEGKSLFIASSAILILSFVGLLYVGNPSSLNDVFRTLCLSYILSSVVYLFRFARLF